MPPDPVLEVDTPLGRRRSTARSCSPTSSGSAGCSAGPGLDVDTGADRHFPRALTLLGFDRRRDVRAAGRAIFVRRREDGRLYEAAFDLFWRRPAEPSRRRAASCPGSARTSARERPADPADGRGREADDEPLARSGPAPRA